MTAAADRYVVVVRRTMDETFRAMYEEFAQEPLVAGVIWDRRVAERRVARQPVSVERRRGDRRGPPGETWTTLGFVVSSHPRGTARP